MEHDTIIKQRTELQLLISELRDRDKELNEMVQAHHTEMKAWQEDRLRSHSLEQRCAKLDRESQAKLYNNNNIVIDKVYPRSLQVYLFGFINPTNIQALNFSKFRANITV